MSFQDNVYLDSSFLDQIPIFVFELYIRWCFMNLDTHIRLGRAFHTYILNKEVKLYNYLNFSVLYLNSLINYYFIQKFGLIYFSALLNTQFFKKRIYNSINTKRHMLREVSRGYECSKRDFFSKSTQLKKVSSKI